MNRTSQGTAAEKADLKTNIVLQTANFRSKLSWFESDIPENTAKNEVTLSSGLVLVKVKMVNWLHH